MNKVLVIVGPTASGKSDLAVRLAHRLGGEVISADSRQVYKGLNVGTGKITRREMQGIPHHLLDVVECKKQFTVSEFASHAKEALKLIEARHALPIIVGGTGFYIDALTTGMVLPEVPPNKKLRDKLALKSNITLFKLLKKKDPKRARTIDPHNKVRLIRALEIVEALGKVPTWRSDREVIKKFVYIGLCPNDLEKRIHTRLLKRMPRMILEAKKLLKARKLTYKRMHELGLEYRYIALFLQGRLSKEEMVPQLHKAIRNYAKRQMTWFKRNKKIKWFKPDEYKKVKKYLKKNLGGR